MSKLLKINVLCIVISMLINIFPDIVGAEDYLWLELSSQMQRYIKINFKRRFPVQAFAWTLI